MEKYIIQKTQKIVAGLYLVTDFIKDNDAIKWEIREEGIALISDSLSFKTILIIDKDHAVSHFLNVTEKIISYLNIAMTSSLISPMNTNILVHEIEALVNFIQKENKQIHPPGYILSDSFFSTDLDDKKTENLDKGQGLSLRTGVENNSKAAGKSNRKEGIINLLKKDSNLSIKDFSKVIKDCSEKTIQRELTELVKNGLVKKQGERRWSTYSLA